MRRGDDPHPHTCTTTTTNASTALALQHCHSRISNRRRSETSDKVSFRVSRRSATSSLGLRKELRKATATAAGVGIVQHMFIVVGGLDCGRIINEEVVVAGHSGVGPGGTVVRRSPAEWGFDATLDGGAAQGHHPFPKILYGVSGCYVCIHSRNVNGEGRLTTTREKRGARGVKVGGGAVAHPGALGVLQGIAQLTSTKMVIDSGGINSSRPPFGSGGLR